MTPRELQTYITKGPLAAQLAANVHTAAMPRIRGDEARAKDAAVAAAINAAGTLSQPISRMIGLADIVATLPTIGAILLDDLEVLAASDKKAKWALKLLASDRMDASGEFFAAVVAALVAANKIDAAAAEKLLALGTQPLHITPEQVSIALRGPWE